MLMLLDEERSGKEHADALRRALIAGSSERESFDRARQLFPEYFEEPETKEKPDEDNTVFRPPEPAERDDIDRWIDEHTDQSASLGPLGEWV